MKDKLIKLQNRIFHSNTIFTQLVLFTVIVSLVPILTISALLFQKLSGMVTRDLVNSHSQLVVQYMSNVEDKLYQYKNSLSQIANNTIVLDTLMDSSDESNPYIKGNKVSIEVTKSLRLESHKELRNCMIYSDMSNNKIYGTKVAMAEGAKSEIWYLNHKAPEEDYFIYSVVDGKSDVLSLIQNIVYVNTKTFDRKYVGFIKLDIIMQKLIVPVSDPEQLKYPYDIILLDKSNKIIYSTNKNYDNILTKMTFEDLQQKGVGYYKDAMVNTAAIEDYGLKLIFLFNNSQLNEKMAEMQRTILPVFFMIMIIIIITAFLFTRGFSERVARLVKKIKVAETGDLTITEEIEGNDEISVLDKQFNQMLIKLDDLIQKNYIQQLEKKETEFRNLQLQINPHFLYNTLEIISSIAAVKQAFAICELCEKLGDIFRYSLGKNYGEYVTVMQELKHTQNYVFIQKTRFGNKFEVFYNVEPDLEDKMILRFILQPIVENAITHGLSHITGKGTLEIVISREQEHESAVKDNKTTDISLEKIDKSVLVIKIEDDGIGMSPEKVDALNRYINSEGKTADENRRSIGIRNVNQRIKLACGNEYGITIESVQYQGSSVIIRLPMIGKGEDL
jgi:sensor histidine kinase YesM